MDSLDFDLVKRFPSAGHRNIPHCDMCHKAMVLAQEVILRQESTVRRIIVCADCRDNICICDNCFYANMVSIPAAYCLKRKIRLAGCKICAEWEQRVVIDVMVDDTVSGFIRGE